MVVTHTEGPWTVSYTGVETSPPGHPEPWTETVTRTELRLRDPPRVDSLVLQRRPVSSMNQPIQYRPFEPEGPRRGPG